MNNTEQSNRAAIEEIQMLVSRFADACMRQDAAAFKKLWTTDAEWQIGEPFPLMEKGRDMVVAAFVKLLGQWEFFAQFPHSLLVQVDGSLATARCSVEELGQNAKTNSSYHNIAYYFDEFRLENGVWLFRRRDYRYLWLGDGIGGRSFSAELNLTSINAEGGERIAECRPNGSL